MYSAFDSYCDLITGVWQYHNSCCICVYSSG